MQLMASDYCYHCRVTRLATGLVSASGWIVCCTSQQGLCRHQVGLSVAHCNRVCVGIRLDLYVFCTYVDPPPFSAIHLYCEKVFPGSLGGWIVDAELSFKFQSLAVNNFKPIVHIYDSKSVLGHTCLHHLSG